MWLQLVVEENFEGRWVHNSPRPPHVGSSLFRLTVPSCLSSLVLQRKKLNRPLHFQQHGMRTGPRTTSLFYTKEEMQWVFCSTCCGKTLCPYSLNFSVFSFIMSAIRCQHLQLLKVTVVCISVVFTSFIQFKGTNLEFIIKLLFSHCVTQRIRSSI